jgi:hypothetical protein
MISNPSALLLVLTGADSPLHFPLEGKGRVGGGRTTYVHGIRFKKGTEGCHRQ